MNTKDMVATQSLDAVHARPTPAPEPQLAVFVIKELSSVEHTVQKVRKGSRFVAHVPLGMD